MKPDAAWTFEKPHRTPGGRVFNLIGRQLRRWGWKRPITLKAILDSACRFTRLSDWGDERFQKPLRVLVDALENEAHLSPLGRLFMKLNLRHFAANRLWVREFQKKHPEALEEPVTRPLFVLGLPRSGTTMLHNLLGQDSSRRALRLWEAVQPAPSVDVAAGKRDLRLLKTRLFVNGLNRWGEPRLKRVHALDADGPEECTFLLLNTFVSPAFFLFGDIPSYFDWLATRGREMLPWVYEQYRGYLQVLQCQGRRGPWVLKSPVHSFGLEALLRVFPDACVVRMHRDLKQVVPSACSLCAIVRGVYSDDVDCRRLGQEFTRLFGEYQKDSAGETVGVDSPRVFHIQYHSLVSDPLGSVRAIHDHFGLPWEEGMAPRMRDWLARNPPHKHGVHHYDLEQFGLTEADMDQNFGTSLVDQAFQPDTRQRQAGKPDLPIQRR